MSFWSSHFFSTFQKPVIVQHLTRRNNYWFLKWADYGSLFDFKHISRYLNNNNNNNNNNNSNNNNNNNDDSNNNNDSSNDDDDDNF